MRPSKSEILGLAEAICLEAGKRLRKAFKGACELDAVLAHDVKAKADRETEAFIRQKILKARKSDSILGEEQGEETKKGKGLWVIDPIDGTINFSRRDPYFATTLAWQYDGETQVGVIYAPMTDELYYATKGGGAYKNGKRLHVSANTNLKTAMVHVGCGKGKEILPQWRRLEKIVKEIHSVRFKCCATLDLCALAEGNCEGYFDMGLYPWDFLAGKLIVEEAGGAVEISPGAEEGTFDCLAGTKSFVSAFKNQI